MKSFKQFINESSEKVTFNIPGSGTIDLSIVDKDTVNGITIMMVKDSGEFFVAVVDKNTNIKDTLKPGNGVSITPNAGSGTIKKFFKAAVVAAKTTTDIKEIAKAGQK